MTPTPAPRKSGPPEAKTPAGKRRRAPFEIDRIVALRVALAAVVGLFLYMILRVSMIAYGGSAAREAKHIEHAEDGKAATAAPKKPAGAPAP